MTASQSTPVLAGVAQIGQCADDPAAAAEPLDLMIRPTRAAAEDAGAPALLTDASAVRVIRGMWPYGNPARAVAEAIGNPAAETGVSFWGGEHAGDIGLAACLLPDGRGAWGNTRDVDVLDRMLAEAFCGRQARIDTGGTVTF